MEDISVICSLYKVSFQSSFRLIENLKINSLNLLNLAANHSIENSSHLVL